jgi:hypothetical protein
MSTISAGTTSNTALVSTGDTTGNLVLRANTSTTALTLNTSGAVGVGTSPSFGTAGQVLTSAGSAAAPTWTTVSAGAAGSNTQVQFNDGGTALGGDAGLTYDKATDNLTIAGNLVIGTSGKGIDFSATPGTGTSELLADYEEGTWTPVLSDGTNNATMGASNVGRYVKIGSQVTLFAYVVTSSLGSVSGSLRITGIPFNAGSNMNSGSAAGYGQSLIIVAGQSVCCLITAASAYVDLRIWSAITGTTQLQNTNWTGSGGGIIFSITYNT